MALEFILFYIVFNIHHVHEIITCWDRLKQTPSGSMLLVQRSQHPKSPPPGIIIQHGQTRVVTVVKSIPENRKYVLLSAESSERKQCSPNWPMQCLLVLG